MDCTGDYTPNNPNLKSVNDKRKRVLLTPSPTYTNKRKPDCDPQQRLNKKWTQAERELLLSIVGSNTKGKENVSWPFVARTLNEKFCTDRTAKSCQNCYMRATAFSQCDSEPKRKTVCEASCQTDISLPPSGYFTFISNLSDLESEPVEFTPEMSSTCSSKSDSSVLRHLLLEDNFQPRATSTPKPDKMACSVAEKKEESPKVLYENDHMYVQKNKKGKKKNIRAPINRLKTNKEIVDVICNQSSTSFFISMQENMRLRLMLSRTRNIKVISKAILSIPSLRNIIIDDICMSVGERPNHMRNKKHGFVSSLMPKSCEALENLQLTKLVDEMHDQFPELFKLLFCMMIPIEKKNCATTIANIIPRLAMIYGIAMQARHHEWSRLQRVISMCLADYICDQKVYDRLNRFGVASPYCVTINTINQLGKRYPKILVEAMQEGKYIRLIGDNLNFSVGTSHETKSNHKHMVHMFTSTALISDHHFLDKPNVPEIPLDQLSLDDVLLSKAEYNVIKHDAVEIVIEVAIKFLPQMEFLKNTLPTKPVVAEHVVKKTKVIPLPCLPFNEQCYQDDVQILAWYQQLCHTILTESGADPTIKFQIGGDQLTRERFTEALLLRFGNIDPQDRFANLGRCVAEFFHLGMNYLEKVIFNELWNEKGLVEMGTLRGECERISRKSVDPNVMKAYDSDKTFVHNYMVATVVEGLLHFFGMESINDVPSKNIPPTFESHEERRKWTYQIIGNFIDSYVFPEWSGSETESLCGISEEFLEITLSNGEKINIPTGTQEVYSRNPDKIKDYSHYVLEVGMIFTYFLKLCKSPDRSKFLGLVKMMMVQLRGHSINAKYPKEILRMLVQQYSEMGLQEACQVFHACFVNLQGKPDSNVPADLVQEWNVKESKDHIKHMFSNKQEANILHRTSALPSMHAVAENIDQQAGTIVRAKRHKEKGNDEDELSMMEDLRTIRPFNHVEGRHYEQFQKIPRSLSKKVDGLKLQKWFHKRKNTFH